MEVAEKFVIKKCACDTCDAIWHNIPKSYTKCDSCGGRTIEINKETYEKKFKNWFFQYDFQTKEYYRENER